jgi:putative transposase
MTLALDLTLKDEDLEPFWNEVSQEYHALLWLPRKTELPEVDSRSSKKLSNYQVEKLESWKRTLKPKNSIQNHLSVSSQALSALITEKDLQKEEIITTHKIQIFPEEEFKFISALHTYRRAYNLTIEAFNSGKQPSSELRAEIVSKIRGEANLIINVNLIQSAYRKAQTALSTARKKYKETKVFSKLSFMSWKYSPRYFIVDKLAKNRSIYNKILGKVSYSEDSTPEAIGKTTIIKYEFGKWYACLQKITKIKKVSKKNKNVVALDPGIRTFITSYNESQVCEYGMKFSETKLMSLALSIDKLISIKQKLLNLKDDKQWIRDKIKECDKKIDKFKFKRKNILNDFHYKVAYDLVSKFDIILLPSFQVSKMINKKDNGKRKLRRQTIREMTDLGHYKFKLIIKWLAKKYGKVVIDVNEAYTSKTFNGNILKIGSKKKIRVNNSIIDRDINASRNILIRWLTKHSI